jgi:hypothetical protein
MKNFSETIWNQPIVAQCLNELRHHVPQYIYVPLINIDASEEVEIKISYSAPQNTAVTKHTLSPTLEIPTFEI